MRPIVFCLALLFLFSACSDSNQPVSETNLVEKSMSGSVQSLTPCACENWKAVVNGTGKVKIGTTTYNLSSGDTVIISAPSCWSAQNFKIEMAPLTIVPIEIPGIPVEGNGQIVEAPMNVTVTGKVG